MTGYAVEVDADGDAGVAAKRPEMVRNVRMLTCRSKVLPHSHAALHQRVLTAHTHNY